MESSWRIRLVELVTLVWIWQSAFLVVTGLSVTTFVSSTTNTDTAKKQNPQQYSTRFIFLHGRLEAEDGHEPFPPPCELYSDFCQRLVDRVDNDSSSCSLLMVEYDDLLASDIRNEPRSLQKWGPITSSIVKSLQDTALWTRSDDEEPPQKKNNLILISFSMGAAIALKILLRQEHPITQSISHVVFVEPVWRCWSSWAERIETKCCIDIPSALAFVGTNDEETGTDSGGSVKSSLGKLFSTTSQEQDQLKVKQLKGANHWAILNENIELSKDRLDPSLTPSLVQEEIVDCIIKFCKLS